MAEWDCTVLQAVGGLQILEPSLWFQNLQILAQIT